MKCPECGFELTDGQLYCECCGKEIQIVPDFEPEIENSIIETLSTVAEEIAPERQEELSATPEEASAGEKPPAEEGSPLGEKSPAAEKLTGGEVPPFKRKPAATEKKRRQKSPKGPTETHQLKTGLLWGISAFVIFVVVALIAGGMVYRTYSVSYQVEQAQLAADAGDYQKAAEYMEKADELLPEDVEIKYTLATYRDMNQESEQAVRILLTIIQSDRYTVEEKEKVYERLIAILDEQGKYQEISDLLVSCEEEMLVTRFQSYLAMEPEFSVAPGSYSEVILLKLSSNTAGKIYYTLNGSKPTAASTVYTAPIFLETGEYIVSAMFVNDYGIASEIVRNSYHIDLMVPDPPEVSLYSGLYVKPTMIEVELPLSGAVYYTTNGNVPTMDSNRYTGPIAMPLGRTEYNFVTVSEEGVTSEVVNRVFELHLQTAVTPQNAIDKIIQALIDRQVLLDTTGLSFGRDGYYEFAFDALIEIPGKGLYYKIDEYFRQEDGIGEPTERLYAVEVYSGTPNRLIYNELGEMDLISLE